MQVPKNADEELSDLEVTPALVQKYKALWVTNKRLLKQIDILRMEIGEKDRIIRQLKVEIDSNILENTKNKLDFLRMVEGEVNHKTQQAKQDYLAKVANLDMQYWKKTALLFNIEKQLSFEKQQNAKLCTRIRDLKQHIIVALDQKDLIIKELTNIVNRQQMQVKVEQIKRDTLDRYGVGPDTNRTGLGWKGVPDAGKPAAKNNEKSKVQIKRNV